MTAIIIMSSPDCVLNSGVCFSFCSKFQLTVFDHAAMLLALISLLVRTLYESVKSFGAENLSGVSNFIMTAFATSFGAETLLSPHKFSAPSVCSKTLKLFTKLLLLQSLEMKKL